MEDAKVWMVVYRLKIRRKWMVAALAFESHAAAALHWEDRKMWALSNGHDYDLIFMSTEGGSDINAMPKGNAACEVGQ